MRLLVTRPRPDADELADELRRRGHEAAVAPMLEIRCRPLDVPDPGSLEGIVVTSRNALACLAAATDLRRLSALPLYAVGEATAVFARGLGFREVHQGPGRASDLVEVIAGRCPGRSGVRLYHPGGAEKAFDLAPPLAARGITLVEATAYEAVDAAAFPADVVALLRAGGIDAVLLMSPKSAATFTRLAVAAGVAGAIAGIEALCLSAAVAAALDGLAPRRTRIAAAPNLAALLALVDRPPEAG